MINKLFIACSLLVLVSCKTLNPNITFDDLLEQRSDLAKQVENNATDTNCILNTNHQLDQYRVNNNVWGLSKLKNKSASLCTYYMDGMYAWKWQVPDNAKGVIGYPALQFGASPWSVTEEKQGFPIQLSAINSLAVTYDTELYVKHRKYNLAFDLWLSSEFYSSQKTITTEIMIWEDWFDFKSYGKKVDVLLTPFGSYEVYAGFLDNKKFNQDWQYYAFVRKSKRQRGEVDIKYLLDYLKEKFELNQDEYLTSIEFGNEIGNSKGFTLVKSLDIKLNK